jgi:hypothetical protein
MELEQALAEQKADLENRDVEIGALRRRLADLEPLLARLKQAVDGAAPRERRRWPAPAIISVALVAAIGAGWFLSGRARGIPARAMSISGSSPAARAAQAQQPAFAEEACSRLGVRLTVDGADGEATARGEYDLAGHKYRRDGSRSPWFTVHGPPLYVHGVGDFLPGDVGKTQLTLITIMTQGETDGYRLARGGKSLLEVLGSDGKRIYGRFEADISKVEDTTVDPPFGTPVVRARGTFCLPARPADPTDTGP